MNKNLRACSQKEFVLKSTANFRTVYLLSTSPFNENFTSFKTSLKILKINYLFWNIFGKPCKGIPFRSNAEAFLGVAKISTKSS